MMHLVSKYMLEILVKKIDYIELDGINFVLFIHAMNIYGISSTLEDFNHPRLVGKSYVYLTTISDSKCIRVEDKIDKNLEDFYDINEKKMNLFKEKKSIRINLKAGIIVRKI